MEDQQPIPEEPLDEQQTIAKGTILAQCQRLGAAGITFVVARFDGSGDEGVTEDVACYTGDICLEEGGDRIDHDASDLQEHFETLVPCGYEDGCGGFGTVILNVRERKITVERNHRFEDYSTTTYEV
jgi:hypothetical protein